MGLNSGFDKKGLLSLAASLFAIVCIFSQYKNVFSLTKKIPRAVIIYSAVSTAGICRFARKLFVTVYSRSGLIGKLTDRVGISQNVFLNAVSSVAAILSCLTVFVLVSLLLNSVADKLRPLFSSLSKTEAVIYSLIAAALIALVCFAFFRSEAFWGTEVAYDILYTSDSPELVKNNVYLWLCHPENDLRQPLFAVFAAPFVGFGYILSLPLAHFDPAFTPVFMNIIQVLMMLTANLMLAKRATSNATGRICFMLISGVTYTTLLFSLMMEQYIVSYFWVVFVVFSYIENKKASAVSLTAAGGTLLTSLALVPTAWENDLPVKTGKLRAFVSAVEKSVLCFGMFVVAFCRLDVLLDLSESTNHLSNYVGGESLAGRARQFLSFTASCFAAPDAGIDTVSHDHISWQMSESAASNVSILGAVILILCLVSFIVNRKEPLAGISALWICFSGILLWAVGWGSVENGMILYSLYFGWAFLVLLFRLSERIADKLKFKYFTPVVCGAAIIALAAANYRGISEILEFAFKYYPV
ncbi:MAG: hypothetical protein K5756_02240 [Clostridiales bacterium]|nr:hypothetical protein [Clostridiales bacterium]